MTEHPAAESVAELAAACSEYLTTGVMLRISVADILGLTQSWKKQTDLLNRHHAIQKVYRDTGDCEMCARFVSLPHAALGQGEG